MPWNFEAIICFSEELVLFLNQVKGMAFNKGVKLHPRDERDDAGNIVHKVFVDHFCTTH